MIRRAFTQLTLAACLKVIATLTFLMGMSRHVFWHQHEHKANLVIESHAHVECNVSNRDYFPIDIVYLWIGEVSQQTCSSLDNKTFESYESTQLCTREVISENFGEFKYSLRSLNKFVPWYNKIFIVIDPTIIIPSWINTSNEKIVFVSSNEIFRNKSRGINSHNSEAIESNIHHIKNLSEHFIYMNDDFMFGNYAPKELFFTKNGIPVMLDTVRQDYMDRRQNFTYYCLEKTINDMRKQFGQTVNYPKFTIRNHGEHMPRPFRKSDLYKFESEFSQWMQFIESHERRYQPHCHGTSKKSARRTYSHSLWLHVVRRRIDQIDPIVFVETNKTEHAVQSHMFICCSKMKTSERFEKNIRQLEVSKPYTFTINDNYKDDESRQIAIRFYETQFRASYNNTLEKRIRAQNVVITGMVHNAEDSLASILTQVDLLACHFGNSEIIIFENNSKDRTYEILQKWMKTESYCLTSHSKHVSKKLLHLAANEDIATNAATREQRYAIYRNYILNYTVHERHCQPYCFDYMISIDMDLQGLNVGTLMGQFENFAELYPTGTMCANGITSYFKTGKTVGIYRDTFATLLVNNVWCHRPKSNLQKCRQIFQTHRFTQVNSCFGSVAIYNFSQINQSECRYDESVDLTSTDKLNYGDDIYNHFVKKTKSSICEHIPYHYCLRTHAKSEYTSNFYVARDAVVFYGNE